MSEPVPYDPRYKKPPVLFTDERKMRYLQELRKSGLVNLSASLAGVSIGTVSDARKKDPEFNEACDEAKQLWIDEVLVSEAVRRATKGTSKPIIGGRWKDEIITHEQQYSDTLMLALLRAGRADFRSGGEDANRFTQGASGVLILPSAPTTMTDWEETYGDLAKGTVHREPSRG